MHHVPHQSTPLAILVCTHLQRPSSTTKHLAPEYSLFTFKLIWPYHTRQNWQVPAAIRPAAVAGQERRVNSNLLVYYMSIPPAPRDIRAYINLGFTAQQLPYDIRGNHQTSMKVLQTVSNYISLHTKIKRSVQTRHSDWIFSSANVCL